MNIESVVTQELRSKPRELKPEEIFLVQMLDLELNPDIGILKPAEVVGLEGEFSSLDLFNGFAKDRLDRQADLLGGTYGTKRNSAKLKEAVDAANDVNHALKAKDTTPEVILDIVTAADIVRHQDPKRVFRLCFKHNWTYQPEVTNPNDKKEVLRQERAKRLMLELLQAILELKLLTPAEFLKALDYDVIASRFANRRAPEDVLARMLETAVTMGEACEKARLEREKDPRKAKEPVTEKPFKASHFIGILSPDLMVECFTLDQLKPVILAVAKKSDWSTKEPEPTSPEDPEDSRQTRRPEPGDAAASLNPATTPALDDPAPVDSIPPPAESTDDDVGFVKTTEKATTTTQASADDVEIIIEDGGTGSLPAVLDPSKTAALPPRLPPRVGTTEDHKLTSEEVDREFDALLGGSDQPVPLSLPGDETMLTAANPQTAADWKGKGKHDPGGSKSGSSPSSPGSGSRSPSSLKPR